MGAGLVAPDHGLILSVIRAGALRTALRGWLGYIDAAILDWVHNHDLTRDQLCDLLVAAFGPALLAAQQADPKIQLEVS